MTPFDLAFVSSDRNPALFQRGPSFVYRSENLGHALAEQGHEVAFEHLKRFKGDRGSTAVIFHRPRASLRLWSLLRRLGRGGVKLLADLDDLVFDEALAEYSPGVLNGLVPLARTRRLFRAHRRALGWFDGITVSSAPLAEHVRRVIPSARVAVISNCIHHDWRASGESEVAGNEQRVITYLPGTRSHNRDFALIAEPLSRFLLAHPEVRLEITGPLEFDLAAHPGQVVHRDRVPFANYASLFRRGWVNLAPLEDTPFNQCKSALKIMEAGYWGIPTICSPNPDNQRFARAGAVIAETADAWFDSLERLSDPNEYRNVTEDLPTRTLALSDIREQAGRFIDFVESLSRG